jgi:CxxC motif-containing protein (DUF1111 family)
MHSASHVRNAGHSLLCGGLAALFVAATVGAKELQAHREATSPTSDETVEAGRELFSRTWSPNDPRSHGGDGLGPVFNAQSCLDCHDQGGPGGSGRAERNIEIATATGGTMAGSGFGYSFFMDFGAGRFEYSFGTGDSREGRRKAPADLAGLESIHPGFRAGRSVVLHRFGTDPEYQAWRAKVPGRRGAVRVEISERNPTPLFGAGLIDAIPDEAIEAAARRRPSGASGVRGRVARVKGGRVGRFGWKAQTETLEEFVLSAAASEVGLEVPGHHQAGDPRLPGIGAKGLDMDRDECAALVAYVRSLPAPVEHVPADAKEAARIEAGGATFAAIGCASCHLPKLGDVEGIYSDLLLHDMGPKLVDTGTYGVFVASPAGAGGPDAEGGPRGESSGVLVQEWRTPPLWGLRDSAPYLHDGRAATIAQAIAQHGGQGAAAARRYANLPPLRRGQLDAFLQSLSSPPLEDEETDLAQARRRH